MKEHNFIRSKGVREFEEIIFCAKCGYVVWYFNMSADWNVENLQSKLPVECNYLSTNK